MPEGHTVHRLARTFANVFGGHTVHVTSPQGRFEQGAALLNGAQLVHAQAYGKHLFLGFAPTPNTPTATHTDETPPESLRWLRVHLGLYGSWTFAAHPNTPIAHAIGAPRRRIGEREHDLTPDQPEPHDTWTIPEPRGQVRVRIATTHAVADLTGPTACEVLTYEQTRHHIDQLGPDPIRDDADPQRFLTAVNRSRSAIGGLLMNQKTIAGVGNIYRAEALFRARLSPYTPGNTIPTHTLTALWNDLVTLMRQGAHTGAIVTTHPADRNTTPPAPNNPRNRTRQNTDHTPDAIPTDQAFYVYQRHGQPCRRCGTPIALADMQARKLYWCPTCQSTSGEVLEHPA